MRIGTGPKRSVILFRMASLTSAKI